MRQPGQLFAKGVVQALFQVQSPLRQPIQMDARVRALQPRRQLLELLCPSGHLSLHR